MLSIVIPALDAANHLPSTFKALVPACLDGVVKEVIVVDGGSVDDTRMLADLAGATVIAARKGRGSQLRTGGDVARSDWLLFLHADTVLEEGWEWSVLSFVESSIESDDHRRAGYFRFALDSGALPARLLEYGVAARCALFGLPYGDQGLLISREFYRELGGYSDMPLMEDVEIVRRIGRGRLRRIPHKALTSASRYRRDGFIRRSLRNLACLGLYFMKVPPHRIARFYG